MGKELRWRMLVVQPVVNWLERVQTAVEGEHYFGRRWVHGSKRQDAIVAELLTRQTRLLTIECGVM
jgi:hypothetical protein